MELYYQQKSNSFQTLKFSKIWYRLIKIKLYYQGKKTVLISANQNQAYLSENSQLFWYQLISSDP